MAMTCRSSTNHNLIRYNGLSTIFPVTSTMLQCCFNRLPAVLYVLSGSGWACSNTIVTAWSTVIIGYGDSLGLYATRLGSTWPANVRILETWSAANYSLTQVTMVQLLFAFFVPTQPVQNISPTIMILSLRTHRPGQTVQTQIRLLLEEQIDGEVWSGSTLFAIPSASFG